jgi:hypothetical protein
VVVFHDGTLDRACGISSVIKNYNYADLPRVLAQPLLPGEFHPRGARLQPYWNGQNPAAILDKPLPPSSAGRSFQLLKHFELVEFSKRL